MHTSISKHLSALCLAATLALPAAVLAAPTEEEEEESADETFVKSLLGKSYSGDLELEGWTNFGGGLVSPPIYVSLYQREDETSLVLTSKLSSEEYEVIDALLISKPWKGYAISIACTKGDDFTLRFIGDARGPEDQERWTEVRRAWEIAIETETEAETDAEAGAEPETETDTEPKPEPGKITKTDTKGIKCINPNW